MINMETSFFLSRTFTLAGNFKLLFYKSGFSILGFQTIYAIRSGLQHRPVTKRSLSGQAADEA